MRKPTLTFQEWYNNALAKIEEADDSPTFSIKMTPSASLAKEREMPERDPNSFYGTTRAESTYFEAPGIAPSFLSDPDKISHVDVVVVQPELQGQGLGTTLADAVANLAANVGSQPGETFTMYAEPGNASWMAHRGYVTEDGEPLPVDAPEGTEAYTEGTVQPLESTFKALTSRPFDFSTTIAIRGYDTGEGSTHTIPALRRNLGRPGTRYRRV